MKLASQSSFRGNWGAEHQFHCLGAAYTPATARYRLRMHAAPLEHCYNLFARRCRPIWHVQVRFFTFLQSSGASKIAQNHTLRSHTGPTDFRSHRQCCSRAVQDSCITFPTDSKAFWSQEVHFFMIFATLPSFSLTAQIERSQPFSDRKQPTAGIVRASSHPRAAVQTLLLVRRI